MDTTKIKAQIHDAYREKDLAGLLSIAIDLLKASDAAKRRAEWHKHNSDRYKTLRKGDTFTIIELYNGCQRSGKDLDESIDRYLEAGSVAVHRYTAHESDKY